MGINLLKDQTNLCTYFEKDTYHTSITCFTHECVTQNNRKDADKLLVELSKAILLTVHEETFVFPSNFFDYLKTFALSDKISSEQNEWKARKEQEMMSEIEHAHLPFFY